MVCMKLTALSALVAAVEEGSLRGAARRIGVAQPALTKLVRELERELATTLLVRSTTGVMATAQGKVLYDHACSVARELSDAVQQIEQLGGRMTGELSIGAVPLAVMLLIPETLRTFSQAFPDIQLRVREELYIAQLSNLRMGDVDIALGPIPDNLPAGEFQAEPLMPITMAVVVGKGNPLARARSLRQLADARWVYTSLSGHTGYARLLFERHGLLPPAPAAVVNSTLGLLSLIGHGDCVGLMPMPIAMHPAAAPFIQVVPIEEGHLDLTLGVISRSEALLKPAVRHFIAHLHRAVLHAGKPDLPGRPPA
jgi:LysR family transcriptional regulator, regulator of abg operon